MFAQHADYVQKEHGTGLGDGRKEEEGGIGRGTASELFHNLRSRQYCRQSEWWECLKNKRTKSGPRASGNKV